MHGAGDEWIDVVPGRQARKKNAPAAVPLSVQGTVSGAGRSVAAVAGAARQAGHLVGEVECSTCGGSRLRDDAAAVRLRGKIDRPDLPPAAGRAAGRVQRLAARPATSKRSPASCSAKCDPRAVPGRRGLEYLTLGRRRRRSPAARRSAFAWPARSAADCAACCTCSTSRRSACTRATTAGCSARSKSCATWATRCWWSSTIAK